MRGIAEHSVNLTWTSPETLEQIEQGVRLNYSLNVVKKSGTSSCSHSFQLWESYVFTAPEGAQPCDVYNFSVTTNYDVVGAKYTGAGCSVPSPVLSMMLPSLPDISSLESSLQYSLQKESDGGITMRITFMVSCFFSSCTDIINVCMYLTCMYACMGAACQLL